MRNLAIRLVLWLCARFGISGLDGLPVFSPNVWVDGDPDSMAESGLAFRKAERQRRIDFIMEQCAKLDFTPLEEARRFQSPDVIARGQRWEAFYHEEGGLADMLQAIRREAFEAAAELDPSETDKIYYWATADRNLRKLDQRVRGVIVNGQVALKQAEQLNASKGPPRKSF